MSKPLEITQPELAQVGAVAQPREALSASRALAVWLGLSAVGWALIAGLIVVVV